MLFMRVFLPRPTGRTARAWRQLICRLDVPCSALGDSSHQRGDNASWQQRCVFSNAWRRCSRIPCQSRARRRGRCAVVLKSSLRAATCGGSPHQLESCAKLAAKSANARTAWASQGFIGGRLTTPKPIPIRRSPLLEMQLRPLRRPIELDSFVFTPRRDAS
jgi:hypothetical protein